MKTTMRNLLLSLGLMFLGIAAAAENDFLTKASDSN